MNDRAEVHSVGNPTEYQHRSADIAQELVPTRSVAGLSSILDSVPDVILVLGIGLEITYMNAAGRDVFANTSASDLINEGVFGFIHPDDRDITLSRLPEVLANPGMSVCIELRVHHYEAGTGWKPVEATVVNQLDHPDISGLVVSFRDRVREERIASSAHRLGEALERASDAIVLHDTDGSILHANAVAREALGRDLHKPGWPYPPELTELLVSHALPEARANGSFATEIEVDDGEDERRTLSVVISTSSDGSCVITARDITEQKQVEADLAHRASHDELTGLPNRAALVHRLEQVTVAELTDRVAVLFIDLDRFKNVNDSLGHQFGDDLLRKVTRRLDSVVPDDGLLARFGGDEFVLLLVNDGIEPIDVTATIIARQLHEALTQPFTIGRTPVYTSASIGVSTHTAESDGVDLLRQADLAMFQAKATGRSRTVHYAASMAQRAERNLAIEIELHTAISNGDIFVTYQPILSAKDSRICGFESLVRWRRDGVVIEPGSFLDIAEQSDLITRIDTLVLSRSCHQLAMWKAEFPHAKDLRISVNLSARQLARPDLTDIVRAILEESGVDPVSVVFELTEGNLMTDLTATMAGLEGLRSLGVQLAIDDFGVGYSSLSYLQRFQAHTVKIDRRFVEHADQDNGDARIVEAIVSLARTFGMSTIAEGVETDAQFDRVRELGCDAIQGFLIGRGVEAEHATAQLRQQEDLLNALSNTTTY